LLVLLWNVFNGIGKMIKIRMFPHLKHLSGLLKWEKR
jgi:hypothetical protein